MRFSESIRLGLLIRPQAFGGLFVGNGSCALGAALDAIDYQSLMVRDTKHSRLGNIRFRVTGLDSDGLYRLYTVEAPTEWHSFLSTLHQCPECNTTEMGGSAISHLNDLHRWSRERIADFVELHEISALAAAETVVEETVAK